MLRSGLTWTQFLDGLRLGQGVCWGLALFFLVIVGMVVYKEFSDWWTSWTKIHEPDEPWVRDWLKRATPQEMMAHVVPEVVRSPCETSVPLAPLAGRGGLETPGRPPH